MRKSGRKVMELGFVNTVAELLKRNITNQNVIYATIGMDVVMIVL